MLKKNLLIGTIGNKDVGKTTVLAILAELLFDDGFPIAAFGCKWETLGDLIVKDVGTMISIKEHKVILTDDVKEQDVPKIQALGGLIIKVRRNRYTDHVGRQSILHDYPTETWIENVNSDFFITSFEESLRRLSFDVRDLYYNNIKNSKKWNDCICQ